MIARDCGAINVNAIAVKPKFVEVGQDNVGKGVDITSELLAGFDLVQVDAWGLGFDVADDEVIAIPDAKIRVAGFGLFGQYGDFGFAPFFKRVIGEQVFHRAVITAFGLVTAFGFFVNCV